MMKFSTWLGYSALVMAIAWGGCSLAPQELKQEEAKANEVGKAYEKPVGERKLPELAAEPTWREVLQRAFLANGDLEAAYWEWRAAIERVDMAAAYPNSNISVGYSYMFSAEKIKTWDRQTVAVGFDPAMNLKLPQKVQQSGKVAFDQAQAAGLRFESAKFDLQKKVLTAWLDFALMAEQVRIAKENAALLKSVSTLASDRVKAGAPQQDLLKAQTDYRLAENQVGNMEAELGQMRAMLNGMLARPGDAVLNPPRELPEGRAVPEDAKLIAMGVDRNPALGALAKDVQGRTDALKLAKMAYLPDINPTFSFTGSVAQVAGAAVMLPTTIPMIEGQIKEARMMMQASEAMVRQSKSDRAGQFVATLVALRNAERQRDVFAEIIMPKSKQVWTSSRQAYTAGQISYSELVDTQRTLLDVRRLVAEVRIEREKRLAELETLAGVDVETLKPAATEPTTKPGQ